MSESRWTFYDPQAGTQTIGIYHGDKSGHVIVYHDNNVMIIDFEIFQSKTYSITFNNSLITLSIEQDGNGFSYSFDRESLYSEPSTLDRFKSYFFGLSLAS
ncbi:MAG: hypothetical protein ACI9FN_001375 [Saprospiraceae bacterium]|jgi:hypothetical protein